MVFVLFTTLEASRYIDIRKGGGRASDIDVICIEGERVKVKISNFYIDICWTLPYEERCFFTIV